MFSQICNFVNCSSLPSAELRAVHLCSFLHLFLVAYLLSPSGVAVLQDMGLVPLLWVSQLEQGVDLMGPEVPAYLSNFLVLPVALEGTQAIFQDYNPALFQ